MIDLQYYFRRVIHKIRGRVVRLHPSTKTRGNVLISYTTLPYLDKRKIVLDAHTNRWECMQMAREFLNRGYTVDVIDGKNKEFLPNKKYVYFLDEGGQNFERIISKLNSDCIKIFYGATCYWKFLNNAEQSRLDHIKKKRGVKLPAVRKLTPSNSYELADIVAMLGSDFTVETYPNILKKIVRIPLSTTHTFPFPKNKYFENVKKNFMWFGGAGLAHKGLDLVLEAFSEMPQYSLTVCGKIDPVDPFVQLYKRELYDTTNIRTFGWLDPGGSQFKNICDHSIGIVYPSSSEGCASSVVLCMHAGVIPIVSIQSGVETFDYGITLKENTVKEIQDSIRSISVLDSKALKNKALNTWKYANFHHTRERFASAFAQFVNELEKNIK